MNASRPTIAVTLGDPLGIGPEVVVKALASAERRKRARFVLVGHAWPLHAAASRAGIDPFWWQARQGSPAAATATAHDVLLLEPDDASLAASRFERMEPGPTREGGAASLASLEQAIAWAKLPAGDAARVDAIVTAPISKEAWSKAGSNFPGHTELLASRFGAKRVRMMFEAPGLRTILVTTHIPLMDIRNVLTIGRVAETIELGAQACVRLGVARPRVAVCGLNPHAGEGGLFGDEESRLIEPAIRIAQEAGIEASGPWPGDTVFGAARRGRFDLVVAMYHDQGLIPVKLLAFDRAVNVTVGLPTVRTSPDHGTAYDIAGTNKADPGSMESALDLAVTLVGS